MTEKVSPNAPAVERRRARRYAVDWDVVVTGKDELGSNLDEAGNLRDLSSSGALLSIRRQLRVAVGMRLHLSIRMPSQRERWMSYGAEIVRIDEDRVGLGAAMRFLTARPRLHSTPRTGSRGQD